MRHTALVLGTQWESALRLIPKKYRVDHSPDQYGVEKAFPPPNFLSETNPDDKNHEVSQLTRGLTPPTTEQLYSPATRPHIVPPKYRKNYNFTTGHGRFLYTKDPFWVEARERYWDDLGLALHVYRKNYDHLRRIYRKQWQDANRYNLDEYLTTMNRVKLQEEASQKFTDESREKEWREDLARIDAINELKEKRRRMIVDRRWKIQVWMNERYEEDLQWMEGKVEREFVTLNNLDERISEQLGRWGSRNRSLHKLNMFGRIPYLEDSDCIPELEPQYLFMREGLDDDGREAFRRLSMVSQATARTRTYTPVSPTFADYTLSDSLADEETVAEDVDEDFTPTME